MKFSDLTSDMEMKRDFFFYMHSFEDCQALINLFRDLTSWILHIPLLENYEGIKDLCSDSFIMDEADSASILEDRIRILRKAIDDFINPENLCDSDIIEKSRELDTLLLKYYGS